MAVIEAKDTDFDELVKEGYAIVDFYGDHCGACVFSAPHFREAADDMAFIKFIKVNTSVYPKMAERFEIIGLPTFLCFYNGEVIHRTEGGMDQNRLRAELAVMLYQR